MLGGSPSTGAGQALGPRPHAAPRRLRGNAGRDGGCRLRTPVTRSAAARRARHGSARGLRKPHLVASGDDGGAKGETPSRLRSAVLRLEFFVDDDGSPVVRDWLRSLSLTPAEGPPHRDAGDPSGARCRGLWIGIRSDEGVLPLVRGPNRSPPRRIRRGRRSQQEAAGPGNRRRPRSPPPMEGPSNVVTSRAWNYGLCP